MSPKETQSSSEATSLTPASIWILSKYIELEQILLNSLDTFELVHSINALYTFLWDYYADWYVEYLKTDSTQISFAKELFRQYIITLSPYCPFETEALWSQFFAETKLLALTQKEHDWSQKQLANVQDIESKKEFELVIDFISKVRSMRGLFAIDPVTKLEIMTQNSILLSYRDFIALTGRCTLSGETSEVNYQIQALGYSFSLDIFAYIKDVPTEIGRTQKIITSLEKQIEGLDTQLTNQKFLDHADADIIHEKKTQRETRQIELHDQKQKLTILQNTTV
jgi:valyl-tRNA synthetase